MWLAHVAGRKNSMCTQWNPVPILASHGAYKSGRICYMKMNLSAFLGPKYSDRDTEVTALALLFLREHKIRIQDNGPNFIL